jgi:hypothetical protein
MVSGWSGYVRAELTVDAHNANGRRRAVVNE